MSLSRMESATAGIERFSTRRMIAERLQAIHYPEVRRLHFHPQVMKTLSVDGQIMAEAETSASPDRCLAIRGCLVWSP